MYGESLSKFFSDPVLLNCLIERNDQIWSTSEFGPDVNRELTFGFFRLDLEELELLPEVGDVVFYQENYYEIDVVQENQLFVGKNPEYSYSNGLNQYGTSVSIICKGHLVPADKYGLSIER